MKYQNIDKAACLLEERQELLKLRSTAVSHSVTIAAGAPTGNCCVAIPSATAEALIDGLLRMNEGALQELGVTDIPGWRLPHRPPEGSR